MLYTRLGVDFRNTCGAFPQASISHPSPFSQVQLPRHDKTNEIFRYCSSFPSFSLDLSTSTPLSNCRLWSTLVCDSPGLHPLQIAILLIWSHHTPRNGHEENVKPNRRRIQNAVDGELQVLHLTLEHPIGDEAESQDGEVECRVVVMDVSDTSHSHKWHVVQEPSDDGVDTCIVDLVDVGLLELVVAALPAHEVPGDHEAEDAEGGGRAPVDERVAEKEIFDD